jgi:hypothetical protein
MSDIVELVKIFGGIAGIVALVWRLIDEFGTWLRISVEVTGPSDGWVSALTTTDNKGNRPKPIEFACLLIGPENEDPVATAAALASVIKPQVKIKATNDIVALKEEQSSVPVYSDGRGLVPLPFYYSENVRIADETLTYRAPLDPSELDTNKVYAVRFFIFVKG